MNIIDLLSGHDKRHKLDRLSLLGKKVQEAVVSEHVKSITIVASEVEIMKHVLDGMGVPNYDAGPNGLLVCYDQDELDSHVRCI